MDRLNTWVLVELPRLNQAILDRRRPARDLGTQLRRAVLPHLPAPEYLPPHRARQLVVLLGLVGASVARHYQERDRAHRATPERAFAGCPVGIRRVPFRDYFARLAAHSGTGHCSRDSYASLTRWNVPTTEVWWAGRRVAVLEGVFDDGRVRTYTGTADERRFFELIKLSETLERAANEMLLPLSDRTVSLDGAEALLRVGRAILLLGALRRLNAEFAALRPDDGLRVEYFMDVFRQYAVHWTRGDIPPSGALDPEAIARDLLLGVGNPEYEAHTRTIWPALLDPERALLHRLARIPSLPELALRAAGLDRGTLAALPGARLREVTREHPVLAALYLLATAHARMSGVHLKIAKKYLFVPQRRRDSAGLGDPAVVSNRAGTTGMDERYLDELTRSRHRHALAPLRVLGGDELEAVARLDRARAEAPEELTDLIRYAGPGSEELPPAAALVRPDLLDRTPVLAQREARG